MTAAATVTPITAAASRKAPAPRRRRPAPRRGFGQVRQLSSGRWQARYTGPDLIRHAAPVTFTAKADAEGWLVDERRLIERAQTDPSVVWLPPKVRRDAEKARAEARAKAEAASTFALYSGTWLENRIVSKPLRRRTAHGYRQLLDRFLVPAFGDVPLEKITSEMVGRWHASMDPGKPTQRAHAYSLLRTILGAAVRDERIVRNPCNIEGAGSTKRVHKIEPATLDELRVITENMPPNRRAAVLIAAWCALRFGELTELRRKDIDLEAGVIKVRRAVVYVAGEYVIGRPKSDAGIRDVAIPPHIIAAIADHLDEHVADGPEALLFPDNNGTHLLSSSMFGRRNLYHPDGTPKRIGTGFFNAREVAGRPDLRWHDLRHTGLTMAAQAGATIADLMARAGHSTVQAASRYQHAAGGRDQLLAAKLSAMIDNP